MEEQTILFVIFGIIFLIILYYLFKRKKKILIFEDRRESPEGVVTKWLAGNREFSNLNSAREYARSLK